jgi:hypothetical protein
MIPNIKGPKKTTRPVAHHYIRLITDIDPTTIPADTPVKSEEDVIDVDPPSPHITTDSWVTKRQWYY